MGISGAIGWGSSGVLGAFHSSAPLAAPGSWGVLPAALALGVAPPAALQKVLPVESALLPLLEGAQAVPPQEAPREALPAAAGAAARP